MVVKTTGRTDIGAYFQKSGVLTYKKLPHTPFIVFVESETDVEIHIVESAKKLLSYPDSTKVMGQWRGEWSSDFFQFSVGQVREFLNPAAEREVAAGSMDPSKP